jgi:hypothetical protein
MIEKGVQLILRKAPEWDLDSGEIDFYFWYWGTRAVHLASGKEWDSWSNALDRALLNAQNQETGRVVRGSWDPVGAWCAVGGRVYSTALACLMLQEEWR